MNIREELIALVERTVDGSAERHLYREPLVGFSDPDDPRYGELRTIIGDYHMLPGDILPGVRTVVSFFLPFARGVVEANRKNREVDEAWALAYIYSNRLLTELCRTLVEHCGALGIRAASVPITHAYDQKLLQSGWSHRSAANIAGLGTFGVNNMLITEKGCAGRCGTVFIDAPIEPTRPVGGERCLHKSGGNCRYCLDHCPTGALGEAGFDRFVCNDYLLAVDRGFSHLDTCDVCGKCAMGPCAYLEG